VPLLSWPSPDLAGDFDANISDIAESYLAARGPQLIRLSELGAGTRPRILDALNSGLSFLSYVGHGGAAVWASENVWNSWDAPSLQAQSQQPLRRTMNCLNGYVVAPSYDSLAESLTKADGRGAIAAVSPHRAEAFAACRAAIDRIKTTVPIWKKELHPDGSSDWVDTSRVQE
jgi:hypothetical protein